MLKGTHITLIEQKKFKKTSANGCFCYAPDRFEQYFLLKHTIGRQLIEKKHISYLLIF